MDKVDKLNVRDVPGGSVIAVKAVPGASREGIVGILGDCLKVATSKPAEGGKANKAIAAVIAKALSLPDNRVSVRAGMSSPRKEFRIAGLSAGQVRQRLKRFHPKR